MHRLKAFVEAKNKKVCYKICQRYYWKIQLGRSKYCFLRFSFHLLLIKRAALIFLKLICFDAKDYQRYSRIFHQRNFLFDSKSPLWFKRVEELVFTLIGLRSFVQEEYMPEWYENKVPIQQLAFRTEVAPLVSIVIPVHNQLHFTLICLRSIFLNCSITYPYEIILIDDCSTDATEEVVSKIPGIKYIRNSENLGFLLSCNKAITVARGELICLLNNDTIVLQSWLESLVETILRNTNYGAIGSKGLFPFGLIQEAGGVVFDDANIAQCGRNAHPNDKEYNYPREVDYCSGSSLLFRKSDFEQLNGFDTQFAPAYYEDSDLCFSIRYRLNKKVIYQPQSQLIHFENISTKRKGNLGYNLEVNRIRFYNKWKQANSSVAILVDKK